MAEPQLHPPVLLILAAFSRYPVALDWARQTAENAWGRIVLESPRFEHRETNYYDATMGTDLLKTFFAFESLVDPSELVVHKLKSNEWERDYQQLARHRELRP